MIKITRVVVLVAGLMSMLAATAGVAGATVWTNAGDTAFTATSAGGSFSTSAGTLSCARATMTGTTGASPHVGATWLGVVNAGTLSFEPCRIGGTAYTMSCGAYTFDALSGGGAVVNGQINIPTSNRCSFRAPGPVEACRVSGTLQGSYRNPGIAGVITTAAGGNLTFVHGDDGLCPWGNSVSASASSEVFTVTSGAGGGARGPVITRTP